MPIQTLFKRATALALSSLLLATGAWACKDCPFPLRIADHRWLMPNRQMEVEIYESSPNKQHVLVRVWLRDAATKALLAEGHVLRPTSRQSFSINLEDRGGQMVRGQIRYLDRINDKIMAKFNCINECTIGEYLE